MPRYREREATVYGPLALLPAVVWDGPGSGGRHDGWSVTHVNTGYALGGTIPERTEALRVIYRLKDEDWSFTRKAHAPRSLQEKTKTVLEEAGA